MEKIKKLIAGVLVLSLLFLCSACMGTNNKNGKKWVLVDERTVLVGKGGEELQSETHYGYDSYGRINEQMYKAGSAYRLYYSDFKYDDNGNVIFCTRSDLASIITDCSYEYDSDNNLIKFTEKNSQSTSETTYQYNEHGDKVYEEHHYKSSSYEYTDMTNYATYYENDVLVYCEISITNTDSEGTKYWLSKFSYDKNDNKTTEHKYIAEEDYVGDAKEIIEYNGKTYVLQHIKYYTYEQIEVEKLNENSNTENNYNSNNENNFEKEEITIDPYNGFPAPKELKMVYSDGKTSVKGHTQYHLEINSLYLIEDTDGYNYIVLNYSVKNLMDRKIEIGEAISYNPELVQGQKPLDVYYDLSEECKLAYGEIITQDTIPWELRPWEERSKTVIYEVYDLETSIGVIVWPKTYIGQHIEAEDTIIRQYAF